MQDTFIMAFRKRLKKRGYTNISIYKIKNTDNYLVTAVEPLSFSKVSSEFSIYRMMNDFRF